MRQVIRIDVNGQITWEVAKSSAGHWIGVCRPLGLTMEGATLDELYASINDSFQLLLTDLMASGELDAFLRNHGWRLASQAVRQQGEVEFDVPFELLVRAGRDSARTLLQ
jgi:hypothetical protein